MREDDKGNVNLVIEPYGQLEAKEILNKALEILMDKVEELENKL